MTTFKGPPPTAIRNLPITDELKAVLQQAADAAGIDTINIVSGGQVPKGQGTRRTGSTRHDGGRAADIQLVADGRRLTFTDQSADPAVLAFVTAAAAHGATGIGAGVAYMGNRTIHVGFGTSPADKTKLTWGPQGKSANAPQWLRDAAAAGWATTTPVRAVASEPVQAAARYVVIARHGLELRGGPGKDYKSLKTLPAGTDVDVVGVDEKDPAWVRVDVEMDGLLDGYVFAAFLAPSAADDVDETSDVGSHDHHP